MTDRSSQGSGRTPDEVPNGEPEVPPTTEPVSPPFASSLRAWPARRRRWAKITALILVLVPVAAVITTIRLVGTSPEDQLAVTGQQTDSSLVVRAVARNVDPVRGEITARLTFAPMGDLAGPSGLKRPLRVLVFRTAGNGLLDFAANEPMTPVDLTLALDGSRVTRYPLDRYTAELTVFALGRNDEPIPVDLKLFANIGDFDITATRPAAAAPDVATLSIGVQRGWSTLSWALIMTVVFWVLGLGASSIAWLIVIEDRGIPFWAWGFLAGMLFALPGLRSSLPGSPRLGALIDWGSFYWAVTLVVLSMTILIVMWNRRVRAGRTPDGE